MKVAFFQPEVTFLLHKSYTLPTEVVDGSNESLYYPDKEFDPNLRNGIPWRIFFKIFDVLPVPSRRFSKTLGQDYFGKISSV